MDDEKQRVLARLKDGFSCSQAILSEFGPLLGLPEEYALKIAAPFGGGMARMGGVCGAVSGAYMALGLKCAVATDRDKTGKNSAYEAARAFNESFLSRNGSIMCRDLLGCDISTAEGLAYAKSQKLLTVVCSKMVADAADILRSMLTRI